MLNTTALSPWPLGQDTYHPADHEVFQPSSKVPARLQAAVNVDVDDSGAVHRRSGSTEQAVLTDGQNVVAFGDYLFVQDGEAIKKVDPSDWTSSSLVTGLSEGRVEFLEHAGRLWWTDGATNGQITAAYAATNWGLTAAPAPTLGVAVGNLPAGRYHVACTYVDVNNVEHGCVESATITLSAVGGITVTLTPPTGATHVNIYCSPGPDQPDVVWSQKVAVGALPASITVLATHARNSTRPLRTMGMRGPLAADRLFSYKGYIFQCLDNVVARSEGISPHLFNYETNSRAFPGTYTSGAGTERGFWVATDKGLWFVDGDGTSENWFAQKKDNRVYAKGSLQIDGSLIPSLEAKGLIGLFVSNNGVIAGLPGGQSVCLTQDRMSLDTEGKQAVLAIRTLPSGIRQVVFTLLVAAPALQ